MPQTRLEPAGGVGCAQRHEHNGAGGTESNLESAGRSRPGSSADQELALYDLVREEYKMRCPIPCTDCKYCSPCPSGVNIPGV